MRDQADKLRQVIDNLKIKQKQFTIQENSITAAAKRNARVIAVTSGKGGVGKTVITINLAIALSELGLKVVILDADLGLANVDVLFGIIPQYTLVDVIQNRKSIFEVLCEGPNNIKFISGGSGVEELVKLGKSQLDRFIENIAFLDKIADVILIDTGAGLADSVISFVMSADEVLLVTTPEPTSITDAYALIKMVSNRDRNKTIKVVVNKAESINEGNDILDKLSLVADKFLKVKLNKLGFILDDEMIIKAVKMQEPFLLSNPKSHASAQIRDISEKIVEFNRKKSNDENIGMSAFINRLVNFFRNIN